MGNRLKKNVPVLRFPEFNGDWKTDRSDHFLVRYVNPVDVQVDTEYEQIGIRSHGKGIFHKEPVTGRELGNKRVYWVHPEAFTVNIVFAWEQAVALTSDAEKGFIASHRFLMFLPKENRVDLKFILLFFLRKRGKSLLELASPGGAGRNKTLGQDNFAELQITLPKKEEQEKIASFLGAVDTRLTQLRRKHELLQTYKRGIMQKLFSQQIRFKRDDGQPFPDWEKKKLGKIASFFSGGTPSSTESIFYYGEIPFIKSGEISSDKTGQYLSQEGLKNSSAKMVEIGDLLYALYGATSGEIAISKVKGAINQAVLCIRSTVHKTTFLFNYLKWQKNIITGKYLQGGQGNLSAEIIKSLIVPTPCTAEQEKITNFLTAIDQKIEAVAKQIDLTEQFKKGLLQKMFV